MFEWVRMLWKRIHQNTCEQYCSMHDIANHGGPYGVLHTIAAICYSEPWLPQYSQLFKMLPPIWSNVFEKFSGSNGFTTTSRPTLSWCWFVFSHIHVYERRPFCVRTPATLLSLLTVDNCKRERYRAFDTIFSLSSTYRQSLCIFRIIININVHSRYGPQQLLVATLSPPNTVRRHIRTSGHILW